MNEKLFPSTIINPDTDKPFRADAWLNTLTGLGTSRDKRTSSTQQAVPASMNFQEFENLYHGDTDARNVVDKPAHEMVRKWFKILIDDTVEKNTDNARVETQESAVAEKVDVSSMMHQSLMNLQAPTKVQEWITWGKVFGGSLLFLGIDDGIEDLSEPLDEENIKSFTHLTVYDRWEVTVQEWYADPSEEKFGLPKIYQITQNAVPGGVSLRAGKDHATQARIHETRFLRFNGANTNRRRRVRQNGWHDSVYIPMLDIIRDFATTWASAAHLLQDFAQAIFKLKGLGNMLKSDTGGLVIQRLMMMDAARSVTRMVPIDAEHEDFIRQQTPITGLPAMMELFIIKFASAARMPVSVLFGVQLKAGMNQSGQSELDIWRDTIRSEQEAFLRPPMEQLTRLTFKNKEGPTKGKEPEKWALEFNPLRELDEAQEATRRLNVAQTDVLYLDRAVVSPEEVGQSRYGGDAYSAETTLDTEQRLEDLLAEQTIEREFTGIQVEKFISILEKVAAKALPSEAGLEALIALFGVDRKIAERMLSSLAGFIPEFVPTSLKPKTGETIPNGDDPFARNAAKPLPPALKEQQANPGDPPPKERGDAIPPSPEFKPNDHIHKDPEGGFTGGAIDVGGGLHEHGRADGLGRTMKEKSGELHKHGTKDGMTGEALATFDQARGDAEDGICDKNSPNYDADACARLKQNKE